MEETWSYCSKLLLSSCSALHQATFPLSMTRAPPDRQSVRQSISSHGPSLSSTSHLNHIGNILVVQQLDTTETSSTPSLLKLHATIEGVPATVLIDTGAIC